MSARKKCHMNERALASAHIKMQFSLFQSNDMSFSVVVVLVVAVVALSI